jgi:hypothetical protein
MDIRDQKEEGAGDDEFSDTGISFLHYEQKQEFSRDRLDI